MRSPRYQIPALDLVDVASLVKACTEKWYNQTLCQVNDSVVRLGVVQGEYTGTNTITMMSFSLSWTGTLSSTSKIARWTCVQQGFVVPKGVVHRAPERAVILLVETAAIVPAASPNHARQRTPRGRR
jgi:hypothetical protein